MPSPLIGGDLREEKLNEAKWTSMVVVRAVDGPDMNARECRASRASNDNETDLLSVIGISFRTEGQIWHNDHVRYRSLRYG